MLRYVGVSVLLDRALAATVAAKGSRIFAQTILWKTSSMMTFWWTTVMSIVRDFFCFMGATCRHMSGCKKLALRPQIKAAVFPVGLDAAKKLYYQA